MESTDESKPHAGASPPGQREVGVDGTIPDIPTLMGLRPTLSTIVDVHSRAILGWRLDWPAH